MEHDGVEGVLAADLWKLDAEKSEFGIEFIWGFLASRAVTGETRISSGGCCGFFGLRDGPSAFVTYYAGELGNGDSDERMLSKEKSTSRDIIACNCVSTVAIVEFYVPWELFLDSLNRREMLMFGTLHVMKVC